MRIAFVEAGAGADARRFQPSMRAIMGRTSQRPYLRNSEWNSQSDFILASRLGTRLHRFPNLGETVETRERERERERERDTRVASRRSPIASL